MKEPISEKHIQELTEKMPGASAQRVLRGTGYHLSAINSRCIELYGVAFDERRRQVQDGDRQQKRRALSARQLNSWYISGARRGPTRAGTAVALGE